MSDVSPPARARPAALAELALATALILLALVYLTQFVDRGWVPHDEGQLGQCAALALGGALPHVGFQDAYTGALSQVYAAVFAASASTSSTSGGCCSSGRRGRLSCT